jgi:hypothetical protein
MQMKWNYHHVHSQEEKTMVSIIVAYKTEYLGLCCLDLTCRWPYFNFTHVLFSSMHGLEKHDCKQMPKIYSFYLVGSLIYFGLDEKSQASVLLTYVAFKHMLCVGTEHSLHHGNSEAPTG